MINTNFQATANALRVLFMPSMYLSHAKVATFADLPVPLGKLFADRPHQPLIKAVVLDKDDCFAVPDSEVVYEKYLAKFEELKAAYPGRRLLIVSNTAGDSRWDADGAMAARLLRATGVPVLSHALGKPACGDDIMRYFRNDHPEAGVKSARDIAVVGDRLFTDVVMANMMGAWSVWVEKGVVPWQRKSLFSKMERFIGLWLMQSGFRPVDPLVLPHAGKAE